MAAECGSTGRPERLSQTVEALISGLIDGTEQADFVGASTCSWADKEDSLSYIRAIQLLCAGQPSLIDTNKASVLLTYLRPASTVCEH